LTQGQGIKALLVIKSVTLLSDRSIMYMHALTQDMCVKPLKHHGTRNAYRTCQHLLFGKTEKM